jgi:beta-lactamase class A
MPRPLVSVWAGAPGGPPLVALEPDRPHYAASTMKLPLLIAAHRLHERGELDLDAAVPVRNAFRSVADGSPFALRQEDDQDDDTWDRIGSDMSLRVLARHSTVHSGNLATDVLLAHVGTTEVAAVLADAGCSPTTRLPRGIGDSVARRAGLENVVTAADLALLMSGVATGRVASPEACAAVEEVLAGQQHRDQVPAGLPEGVYVANKTGWVDGVAHDVALVRPSGGPPYVIAICTTADADERTLFALNAAVSAAVWKKWRCA